MFVKLNKEDVYGIVRVGCGRDAPCGNVYINIDDISHIDGQFVVVRDYNICCSDKAIEKILSMLEVVD